MFFAYDLFCYKWYNQRLSRSDPSWSLFAVFVWVVHRRASWLAKKVVVLTRILNFFFEEDIPQNWWRYLHIFCFDIRGCFVLLNLLHFFTYYTNMSSVLFEGETLLVAEVAKTDLDKIRYECNIINILKEVNLFSSKASILYLVYFFPQFFSRSCFFSIIMLFIRDPYILSFLL